jgi:succinoglycan biosynthesis transport protein ExoP
MNMLQISKPKPIADHEPDAASPAVTLRAVVDFVRRQYPVILCALVLTNAFALNYMFTTPPTYTAHAKILIDTRKGQLFQQQSAVGDGGLESAAVESQVEVLKSQSIALSVIKEQHLADHPEGGETSPNWLESLFGSLFHTTNTDTRSDPELIQAAARAFTGSLDVRRVGLTYVIDIGLSSRDRDEAAKLANAVADAYILDQMDAKYQATRRASVWLQDRIAELRDQASAAERAVVDFKTKNNIVSADGKLMNEQQLAELNSQLAGARAKTFEAQARLDRIETVLRGDTINSPDGATVADTLNNSIVTKLRSQYLDMVNREKDWAARYGANHLAVVNLRSQMRGILTSIHDELQRLAETYKSDLEIAKARQQEVEKGLAVLVSQSQETNQVRVALRELESTAHTYTALYDNFLQRYMESVQQQSFPITEARVISPAGRPTFRSAPVARVVFAYAMLGGALIGFGIGWLREMSDRVFRTTAQVETALEQDCIAVLPMVKSDAATAATSSDGKAAASPTDARGLVRQKGAAWSPMDAPFSRFTEEIRSIKLAADLNGATKTSKVIGITSSMPNEGKSTVATALALLAAQTGARVILVDCDLRNPSLSRTLTPKANVGILDIISRKATLEAAVCSDAASKLNFLPAVIKYRLVHSNEILSHGATKQLIEKLRQDYDYVIVDLSPLMPIVDVRASTDLIDSYVFVIEWGRTKIDAVQRALATAKGVYENLLGVVLNKADLAAMAKFGGYAETYRYNKHYARYGYTE